MGSRICCTKSKTRSRELFVITIILLCLGTAFLTFELGPLSVRSAPFSNRHIGIEYASQIADCRHHAVQRELYGLFFISIGMLMDIGFFTHHFAAVAGAVGVILALKVLTA
ncbi:MAG: hypothetical protein U0411_14015 [Thermodesulfovibrionales bacterium]